MKRQSLRALVTCSGGPAGRNTIESLRFVPKTGLFILGVDADPAVVISKQCDAVEQVPMPSDPNFTERIIELIKKYNINIIYPNAADELITLLENRKKISCIIPADNVESIITADDKGLLYPHLLKQGIPVPKSILCSKVKDLEKAIFQLGYPHKEVVVKPRKTSGCRGFHIFDSHINPIQAFTSERPGFLRVRWEDVKTYIRDPLPELVVMDFLDGIDYTCYALVQEGKPLCIIPLRRSGLSPGMSLGGTVEQNESVINYVRDICQSFRFHGFINIQLMVVNGKPLVYEINPRISATTVACTAAGVNIPYLLYKLFSEGKVEIPPISWNTKITRVYHEMVQVNSEDEFVSLSEIFRRRKK